MSAVWLCVLVVGAATIVFKATGPVLLGRRSLPTWLAAPVAMLAPAVLAALVVTQAVGGRRELVADARLAGLAIGAVAIALRAPAGRHHGRGGHGRACPPHLSGERSARNRHAHVTVACAAAR